MRSSKGTRSAGLTAHYNRTRAPLQRDTTLRYSRGAISGKTIECALQQGRTLRWVTCALWQGHNGGPEQRVPAKKAVQVAGSWKPAEQGRSAELAVPEGTGDSFHLGWFGETSLGRLLDSSTSNLASAVRTQLDCLCGCHPKIGLSINPLVLGALLKAPPRGANPPPKKRGKKKNGCCKMPVAFEAAFLRSPSRAVVVSAAGPCANSLWDHNSRSVV